MKQKEKNNHQAWYPALYQPEQREKLKQWWIWLHSEQARGERAVLRRCQSPQEVMMQKGFFKLGYLLPEWQKYHLMGLATVAGILAHIKTENSFSFPAQLGTAKSGTDKPVFSELRFQKLLASSDIDEFYKSLLRAVKQTGNSTDPVSLADGILHWHREQAEPEKFQGQKSWKYRWANDYYSSKLFN